MEICGSARSDGFQNVREKLVTRKVEYERAAS